MSRSTTPRMRKVNELIREIVAEEVTELKDPRIGFVTITGADTAPNLRRAVVFYSVLGSEEEEIIAPAVKRARDGGLDAVGPLPADAAFYFAARGDYDGVVAMYHDQGLGPFKLLHFHDGANITLGLPFVRTSPDHGTAFDLAGTGAANPSSFRSAITYACDIAARRNNRDHA